MGDEAQLEALARAAADGNVQARQGLVERLWPYWLNRVRTRKSLRVLSQSEDHVHNVVARLVQKLLSPATWSSYGSWHAATPHARFMQWLSQVTDNEVTDYVRSVAGRAEPPAKGNEGPSAKLLLNEFATSPLLQELGIRPPNTALQTAQELLTFARARLPPDQLNAVVRWLQGESDEEIGAALDVDVEIARGLRRAAVARLRREFGEEAET